MNARWILSSAVAFAATHCSAPVVSDSGVGDAAALDGSTDAVADDAGPDVVLPPPEAVTRSGMVRGTRGAGYQEFLGIPYAAPPVGPLRWRPPQPVAPWTMPRTATTAPARCPQTLLGLPPGGDEDCLYVNVHTPDPRPARAPVMVWIHGGGFVFGEGLQTDRSTRGDIIARTSGIVVVSLNYRLGQLGFLAHAALTAENTDHVSGNYGLLDQAAALEWVRDNIAAFGGDPSNVTVAGESAGGASVCEHLIMPRSTGLFHRAIVQSGPCGRTGWTLARAETQGTRFAAALACDTAADVLACMRGVPALRILATLPASSTLIDGTAMNGAWGPTIDGRVLPDQPMAIFAAGTFRRVPTMFGWNRDEGSLFTFISNRQNLTAAQYPDAVAAVVGGPGALADRVLAQYPLSAFRNAAAAYSAVIGDLNLACTARRAWRAMAPHVSSGYAYYFTYPDGAFQLSPEPLGAYHSGEIQYIFGHPSRIGQSRFVGADLVLHQTLLGYWSRFVSTGDPNGAGAVAWPRYDSAMDTSLSLDVMPVAAAGASASACAFWETTGVY